MTASPTIPPCAERAVEHRAMVVNGIRMHAVESGSGPLVVLLHGFPETWWSWRYQIEPLAAAGFRVVAPDLRGFGETDIGGPYDAGTLTRDVVALVDALGASSVALVGHDWGAAMAWYAACALGTRCRSLVTINGPHPAMLARALRRSVDQLRRSWYVFFFQLPWLPERWLASHGGRAAARTIRGLAVDPTHFGDEELAPFARAASEPARAKAMIDWYRALRPFRKRGGLAPGDVRAPCRTLVLWGIEDRALAFRHLVPESVRYAPAIEVETLEGAGHFVHEEQPAWVNERLVAFLHRAAPSR